MKNIAIIASVIASAFVLASCASQSTAQQPAASQTTCTHCAHHHDFKGESAAK